MKFNDSILNNADIGQIFFLSSINKANQLLTDVFGLNFYDNDPSIIGINADKDQYRYEVVFNYNGGKIQSVLNYDKTGDDNLQELLYISEHDERIDSETIYFPDDIRTFNDAINKCMAYLEDKYNINFTPLDPGEADENITSVNFNENEETWEAAFIDNNQEAEIKAQYKKDKDGISALNISRFRKHVIYLD